MLGKALGIDLPVKVCSLFSFSEQMKGGICGRRVGSLKLPTHLKLHMDPFVPSHYTLQIVEMSTALVYKTINQINQQVGEYANLNFFLFNMHTSLEIKNNESKIHALKQLMNDLVTVKEIP